MGYAFDSRLVKKGDMFFALKGQKFDGHAFLKEVAEKGAVAAVVDEAYAGPTFGLKLIRVKNVTEELQRMAKEAQSKRKCMVVGVTGSVGKSTTKEYLATLLSAKWKVEKTPGNSNSQVGLPLAILNGQDADVLVAEMGMTQKGEIAKLVEIVPPDVTLVTKVGVAHIGYFSDGQEGIAEAKAEIFSNPKTKIRVVGAGVKRFRAMQGIDAKTFAVEPESADIVLKRGWKIEEGGKETRLFSLPFEESHFCENFAAAAAVARCMGMEWEEILSKTGELKSLGLRFEKIRRNGILFINDCYNAQLDSIESALSNLPKPEKGGKTVVAFGEITDLGRVSEKSHRAVAEKLAALADHLLCYGKGCIPMLDVFAKEKRPAEFFKELSKMKETLFEIAKPGEVVLIKGSRVNKLWQLLE
jgi:UDP-N-acetylmuramoyl-tripeptide--D-alanyl-D-alanine ligase